MTDDRIDLDVLDPDQTWSICVKECGGRCCNFEVNDFTVKLSVQDYRLLVENDLHQFVTFVYQSNAPQLVNQLNGNCIFLSNQGRGCTIHPIRPKICRLYPFAAEEVPEWCGLYHNTSDEVREQLGIKLKDERHLNTKTEGNEDRASILYDKYRKEGDSFVKDEIKQYATLDGANEYWVVFLTENVDIREGRKMIAQLKELHQDTPWKAYSIRVHGSDTSLKYQLLGITRTDFTVDIPYIYSFPPDREDLSRLLDTLEYDPQWRDHIVAGIDIPEELRENLSERICNQN